MPARAASSTRQGVWASAGPLTKSPRAKTAARHHSHVVSIVDAWLLNEPELLASSAILPAQLQQQEGDQRREQEGSQGAVESVSVATPSSRVLAESWALDVRAGQVLGAVHAAPSAGKRPQQVALHLLDTSSVYAMLSCSPCSITRHANRARARRPATPPLWRTSCISGSTSCPHILLKSSSQPALRSRVWGTAQTLPWTPGRRPACPQRARMSTTERAGARRQPGPGPPWTWCPRSAPR